MIDTHTHLYMEDYRDGDPDGSLAAVDRAVEAGVGTMILPSVDRESCEPMIRLHALREDATFTAMGLHPTEVGEDWREELAEIVERLLPTHPVAVGETGIDLYWDKTGLPLQKEAFTEQILLGAIRGLPVIIHCREAVEECLECIVEAGRRLPGESLTPLVFHSFTGTPDDVRRIREVCDPWFGINGVVTFKNARQLPDAVREIGIDRILLETDAPFLAPVPKRGSRNESAYIPYINDRIADILGITPGEVAEATTRNAKHIFRI